MRVISGSYKSRVLEAPAGMGTRPTSDRLRETLFNVLINGAVDRVAGGNFLDLYAGSGAVGIEALSRGAGMVTMVEQAGTALKALEKNLANLRVPRKELVRVEHRSVSRFLHNTLEKLDRLFDVVFLDPPYELEVEYASTLGWLGGHSRALLAADAVVVAEHRRKYALLERYGGLLRYRVLEQGDASLSFYSIDGFRF